MVTVDGVSHNLGWGLVGKAISHAQRLMNDLVAGCCQRYSLIKMLQLREGSGFLLRYENAWTLVPTTCGSADKFHNQNALENNQSSHSS